MEENQNIEYKESWRDEHMKWICGFANGQGGTMYIGVTDKGEVCGVEDAKRLMEDIPNKVRDLMGIIVDVNLVSKDGKDYIAIETAAYPYPISYHGHYYQRSGATNQEMKGSALDRFILRCQGRTWDGVPVPYLKASDLDNATFDLFRRFAKRSRRMDELDLIESNEVLLDKLRLTEGEYLKRAAALLFHPDPERFVTGAYIKIGYFKEHANLIFQDEIHGNLFNQVRKTIDLLTTKYLRAMISYEGIQRVETLPVPEEALRESLLNAVINKDYADCTPIQIRVMDGGIEIVNGGTLPETWTIETLLSAHRSQPYNPDIANAFFRAGEIEAWGRGIHRIVSVCQSESTATVEFRCTPAEFWTIYHFPEMPENVEETALKEDEESGHKSSHKSGHKSTHKDESCNSLEINSEEEKSREKSTLKSREKSTLKNTLKSTLKSTLKTQDKIRYIIAKNPEITREEIAAELDMSLETIKKHVAKLKSQGILRRVGPDKGGHWEVVAQND